MGCLLVTAKIPAISANVYHHGPPQAEQRRTQCSEPKDRGDLCSPYRQPLARHLAGLNGSTDGGDLCSPYRQPTVGQRVGRET